MVSFSLDVLCVCGVTRDIDDDYYRGSPWAQVKSKLFLALGPGRQKIEILAPQGQAWSAKSARSPPTSPILNMARAQAGRAFSLIYRKPFPCGPRPYPGCGKPVAKGRIRARLKIIRHGRLPNRMFHSRLRRTWVLDVYGTHSLFLSIRMCMVVEESWSTP